MMRLFLICEAKRSFPFTSPTEVKGQNWALDYKILWAAARKVCCQ